MKVKSRSRRLLEWLGKSILSANRWYDKQPDSKRFLMFAIPFTSGHIVFSLMDGGWLIMWMVFLMFIILPMRGLGFILK